MERPYKKLIQKDLEKKMVFLTGPRQVGKTTLAKSFFKLWPSTQYLNYDNEDERKIIVKREWDRKAPLIILDEIHKRPKWKSHLKGIYDSEGIPPRILVTGSARLDVYRRGGDSLAGRYFLHRLHPFSIGELRGQDSNQNLLEKLMKLGGFPEPFLEASEVEAARWKKQHLERIIREDVQDLEPVRDIQKLLLLVDVLKERVGSSISIGNIARDLEISPHTLKHWIQTLENMYVIFLLPAYHQNLARAIIKEPKIFFYDTGAVVNEVGARFENLVAGHLKKWVDYLEDVEGKSFKLYFLRDKEKREVDFVIGSGKQIEYLIEAKYADDQLSASLKYYQNKLKPKQTLQLVGQIRRNKTVDGISIYSAADWLAELKV
ncbi:MAG: ATP-binding protein [Deltaproteobacteria bacterium]|nr:ATP-binding protein [Deltaproteobacteria bacterium]